MAIVRVVEEVANLPPDAADDLWFGFPGRSTLVPVSENDTDPDMDGIAILDFSQPGESGMVSQSGMALLFVPSSNFTGGSFMYSITDGKGGYDTATVTVEPVSTFEQFQKASFGLEADDPMIAGELLDPDQDGIVNLLEYAFALNPLVAESDPPVSARIDSGRLVLTVRRWIGATDLQVQGMFCEDLLGWSNAGVTVSEVSSDGFVATDEHTGPLPGDLRQFGQIEVTK